MDSNDIDYFLLASKEAEQWLLMSSPWPIVTILAVYLIFVIKIGPKFMESRKPFPLRPIILIYNLYQIFVNAYLVYQMFTNEGSFSYLWNHSCQPLNPAKNKLWIPFLRASWLFFISRTMDLMDTVFFILSKKQSHVTFLHIFHHTEMALGTWVYIKYIKGEQGIIIGLPNCVVHVIMYTYYFLAALGPQYHKYLWWKKYLTTIQMLQFVGIAAHIAILILANCPVPRYLSMYIFSQAIIFLLLFANFYHKTYTNSNSFSSKVKST